MLHVIVPVKRFCFAKERLSGVRTTAERTELARGFAEHTLRELATATSHAGVTVVSDEDSLRPFAQSMGVEWLDDPGGGLNAALTHALDVLIGCGCNDVAIVHADLPYLCAEEFDRIAARHKAGPSRKMTLVADRRNDGTTLRFCRPARGVPALYGPGSARRHAAYAKAHEIAVDFATSPRFSLDCDTPADLDLLTMDRAASPAGYGGTAQ